MSSTTLPKGSKQSLNGSKSSLTKKISSKVGSLDNISHTPKKSDVKILDQKLDFKNKATSKIGSKDNLSHVPKGGKFISHRKAM